MADRNREQERRMTIDILNEASIKDDGTWEISVLAVIKNNNKPLEGITARLLCGTKDPVNKTTNSDGRTDVFTFKVPINETSVQIEVLAEDNNGHSAQRKKEIILLRPPTLDKRADEWSTRVVGSEGEYTAYVSVSNQNQLPLPGVLIHVYLNRGAQLAGPGVYTNKDGLAIIPIPKFTESFRDIIIEAVGTRLKPKKERLYRRHNKKLPPIPELPNQTHGFRGIWRAIKIGWQASVEMKQKQDQDEA